MPYRRMFRCGCGRGFRKRRRSQNILKKCQTHRSIAFPFRERQPYRQKRPCFETNASQVALLFLANGKLHNEPVWRAFFEAAGEKEIKSSSFEFREIVFAS